MQRPSSVESRINLKKNGKNWKKLEKCLGASSFEDRKECHTNAVVDKQTSASLGNRINCWQGGVSGMTHCFIQFMLSLLLPLLNIRLV